MNGRDFLRLTFVCLIWGANLPLTRWITADVPPLFVVLLRFTGTAVLLAPWLGKPPRHFGRLALAGLCFGGLQFALQYAGLAMAPASSAAIAAQLGLPFTVLLSVLVLGEPMSARRLTGSLIAFAGVLLVSVDPSRVTISMGMALVIASALSVAVGTILMKRLAGIGALQFQAWAGVVSIPPLALATLFLEHGQWHSLVMAGPLKWSAIAYAVLCASIAAQAIYYNIIKRNDVSLVTPLTLMTPVWSVAIGVGLLGEKMSARGVAGALITLAGVAIIAAPERVWNLARG